MQINIDKIIKIIVTIIFIIYIIVLFVEQFDLSEIKSIVSNLNEDLIKENIIIYLNNHDDYYYKINGARYCINKEVLKNELEEDVINNIPTDIVEVIYTNKFEIYYNDECIEN